MSVLIDVTTNDFLFHRELLIKYVYFHEGAVVIKFRNTAIRELDCIHTPKW